MRSIIHIMLFEYWIRMNTLWRNVYLNILRLFIWPIMLWLYSKEFHRICWFSFPNMLRQEDTYIYTIFIIYYIYIRFLCLLLMGWVTSKGWTIGTYDQSVVDIIVGGRLDGKLRNCHEKWEGNDAHNLVVKDDNGPILTFVDDLPNYMSMG